MTILQRNKKAAVGIGIAAAACAVLALGAGTYAAFSDTEAGPSGTLAAGTLSLEVGGTPSAATLFNEPNIYPGKVLPVKTLTITNAGSINGTLSGNATIAPNTGGTLQNQLTVQVACKSDPAGGLKFSAPAVPVAVAGSGGIIPAVPLAAGQTITCTFTFDLPNRDDNNEVQGDKVDISSTFTLAQATTG